MSKFLKGAFLGGMVGAGYVGYQSYKNDEPVDSAANSLAKTAGGAAAVGGLVGLLLDRRAAKQASRAAAFAGYAAAKREDFSKMSKQAIKEGRKRAKQARPQFDHALEQAVILAETARPMLEGFAEQARPVAKDAAKVAKEVAYEVKDNAKPVAKEAATFANDTYITLRPHAEKAAKSAAKHARHYGKRARKVASESELGRSVLIRLN